MKISYNRYVMLCAFILASFTSLFQFAHTEGNTLFKKEMVNKDSFENVKEDFTYDSENFFSGKDIYESFKDHQGVFTIMIYHIIEKII